MRRVLVLCLILISVEGFGNFSVDLSGETFLLDGKPFRYISGSIHYFRVPREYWQDRLHKLRMAGFNTLQTYVEWRSHEPYPGSYNFDGNLDVLHFIKLAHSMGLFVILRPGPYIDAERDMGGLPFWLLQDNPGVDLRTRDPSYMKHVERWFDTLLPMIRPLLYCHGGPIISVQVENEYGSYKCDLSYLIYLRDIMRLYLGPDILLFSTDGAGEKFLECGNVDGVFATVDFGAGSTVKDKFILQKLKNGGGPSVNSEYYSGWLDHWAYPHNVVNTTVFINTFRELLDCNASVNVYMFHGGSNFGFSAGSNLDVVGTNFISGFKVVPTSYDYDALLTEAGDPTWKYYKTRELLAKYVSLPVGPVPVSSLKYAYDSVRLNYIGSLLDLLPYLANGPAVTSKVPLTFESLGQSEGFILYETTLHQQYSDPVVLTCSVHDRGYVFVNKEYVGILSRENKNYKIPISVMPGQKLQILVENEGRICFGKIKDFKGIVSTVVLGEATVSNWTIHRLPLNSTTQLANVISMYDKEIPNGPTFFTGTFIVPNKTDLPLDTFLNPEGWRRGLVIINGFNLGRYWPVVGPQVTLYVPKTILNPFPKPNSVTLMELEGSRCQISTSFCEVKFSYKPFIDSSTPHDKQ